MKINKQFEEAKKKRDEKGILKRLKDFSGVI